MPARTLGQTYGQRPLHALLLFLELLLQEHSAVVAEELVLGHRMESATAPAAAIRRAPQRPRISGTVSSTTSSRPRCHVESARMPPRLLGRCRARVPLPSRPDRALSRAALRSAPRSHRPTRSCPARP